jgi:ribosomal protein L11 methyltransferase
MQKGDYYNYQIKNDTAISEILIAFLSEMSFDAFEEVEDGIDAFILANVNTKETEAALSDLQQSFDFQWTKTLVQHQNWNALWESNFHPVIVEGFCAIRADFHEPFENIPFEIVINPKMAFGTGHHETTYMMMATMQNLDFKHKKVFDYGCGTGILAILAVLLGAEEVEAIDIEEESYWNTVENAQRNGTSSIKALQGTLPDVEGNDFDIILANINRNVILESLPTLYNKVKEGGFLMISGFLKQDEALLNEHCKTTGFQLQQSMERGKWICQLLLK